MDFDVTFCFRYELECIPKNVVPTQTCDDYWFSSLLSHTDNGIKREKLAKNDQQNVPVVKNKIQKSL